jgi:hypothetical protein
MPVVTTEKCSLEDYTPETKINQRAQPCKARMLACCANGRNPRLP